MEKALTLEEMNRQFPSEWLLVVDPVADSSLRVVSGTVAVHSKDRDEVYREAVRLHPKRFATVYTGSVPSDAAIVL